MKCKLVSREGHDEKTTQALLAGKNPAFQVAMKINLFRNREEGQKK